MVSVNDIKIGGYNVHDNTVILGIAFWLNEKSDISLIEEFHDINAAIELKSGSKYIIFRTTEQLEKNEILAQGFRLANIVLDKLSVFENMNYKINNSMNERMMVYQENSKLVFHYNMVTVLSLRGSTSINLVDINEKDFIKELSQQSEWNTAFRYYRMSRLSKDRYEAYRNLYLSFENILSTISKKTKSETEIAWLKRVLRIIEKKYCLKELDINKFVKEHYLDIRCQLFHSKSNEVIIPYSQLKLEEINNAYIDLINFWREITSSVLGFQNNNGGVTNHFLASLVENTFSNSTIEIGWKSIDTERESGELNEKITLQNIKRHVDAKYNIARLQGSYEDIKQLENRSFNRINILEDGHLYCYSDFNENLQISGVDCLDIISHLEILSGNKHYGLISRSNNT